MPSSSKSRSKKTELRRSVDDLSSDCKRRASTSKRWAFFYKYGGMIQAFFIAAACCVIGGLNEIEYNANNGHDLSWLAFFMFLSQAAVLMFNFSDQANKYIRLSSKYNSLSTQARLILSSNNSQDEKIEELTNLTEYVNNLREASFTTNKMEVGEYQYSRPRNTNSQEDEEDEETGRSPRGRSKKSSKKSSRRDKSITIHEEKEEVEMKEEPKKKKK